MHKVDVTTLFTGVCSAVIVANAITLDAVHQAQAHTQAGSVVRVAKLHETNRLIQNDNLMPGLNRTQAMRLEAETGHVNAAADNVLKPKPLVAGEHHRSIAAKSIRTYH